MGISNALAASSLTVDNSVFSGNTGGAIANRQGTMEISGSTFTNNAGFDGGGAIRNFNVLTVTNSTFTGNNATGANASQVGQGCGGAIYNTFQLTINNSLMTGNSAANSGGGICFINPNSAVPFLNVTNTTISGNLANSITTTSGGVGGGIAKDSPGSATVTASTIVGNRVNGINGGGIFLDGGSLTLHNSIIANNTAVAGLDISGGTINSLGYNLIRITTGTTISGTTTGNITGTDPLLGPLSYNGGATHEPTSVLTNVA